MWNRSPWECLVCRWLFLIRSDQILKYLMGLFIAYAAGFAITLAAGFDDPVDAAEDRRDGMMGNLGVSAFIGMGQSLAENFRLSQIGRAVWL